MKNSVILIFLVISWVSLFAQKPEQVTYNGIKYRIITHNTNGRAVNGDSSAVLQMNYKLAIESNDSILVETFTKENAVYVPVIEPNFREVFEQLHTGDSVIITINVDTLFLKSFDLARPPYIKEGENIKFTIKVLAVLDENELMMKREEELLALRIKDSIALAQTISTLANAKTTASGLTYVVEKTGMGKAVKKGDKTKVLYKGTLLNGDVFDENLTEGISFTVGSEQFISGWEEMVKLMKFGDKVKVVIPWNLAYGAGGSGPIPPYSSLIFEMELLKEK